MTVSRINKSAQKRDMLALAKVVDVILALPNDKLSSLQLQTQFISEFAFIKTLRSQIARRRQKKHIVRQLSKCDLTELHTQLGLWRHTHIDEIDYFHATEHWRYRLLNETNAVDIFIETYPHSRGNELKSAVEKAQRCYHNDKKAARELFYLIREILRKYTIKYG